MQPTERMIEAVRQATGFGSAAAGIAARAALGAIEQDYELVMRYPDRVCGAVGPDDVTCQREPDHDAGAENMPGAGHVGTVAFRVDW
jgi:hypothetical protein